MALVVTNGYLVSRYDYNVFDEILTFINEHGVKFVCFAAGTRRIVSKNARALIMGSYLEFQVFSSSKPDKLSRLKKVIAIKQIDWKYENEYPLLVMSEFISKINDYDIPYYQLYQDVLFHVLNDEDQYLITAYAMVKLITLSGSGVNLSHCVRCGSIRDIKTISIQEMGLICKNCYDPLYDKVFPSIMMKMWHILTYEKKFEVHNWYRVPEAKLLITILKQFMENTIGIKITCLKSLKLKAKK